MVGDVQVMGGRRTEAGLGLFVVTTLSAGTLGKKSNRSTLLHVYLLLTTWWLP